MNTTPAADAVPAPNTPAAASLYQRLRGHLAVLKLHDAAEALPAVLDRAQKTNLSMTATLEELLAIEVDATEARRLSGRLRFACLPTPASLEDFDYDAVPSLARSAGDWVVSVAGLGLAGFSSALSTKSSSPSGSPSYIRA